MGEAVSLDAALREKASFVLDSGLFGVSGLEVPPELSRVGKTRLFVSIATKVECVRDQSQASRTQEANIGRLTTLLPITPAISEQAYRFYQELRPLRDDGPGHADIVIAAIRAEGGPRIVVTRDPDFAAIPGVRYVRLT